MLIGFSSKTADTVDPASATAGSLIGIIQRILSSGDNICIMLPNTGEISVLGQRRTFKANDQIAPEFYTSPVTAYTLQSVSDGELTNFSTPEKDIRDLLWQAAFYSHQDSLIEGCSENDVVQFLRWPNLTRLPHTPNAARICALLTRHPTSIALIRRILGIDKKEVNQIISAAFCAGIVNTISRGPSSSSPELQSTEVSLEQPHKPGLWNSLFTKISSL